MPDLPNLLGQIWMFNVKAEDKASCPYFISKNVRSLFLLEFADLLLIVLVLLWIQHVDLSLVLCLSAEDLKCQVNRESSNSEAEVQNNVLEIEAVKDKPVLAQWMFEILQVAVV